MRLWRWARPQPGIIKGMAGGYVPTTGQLPEPGGTLDQGVWLIAAFDIISETTAKFAPPE